MGKCEKYFGYPFVWWFATNPEYEGKGYGSQLLTYVEEAFLRDTFLKSAAVTLGTSARLVQVVTKIYERGYEIYQRT